MVIKKGKDNTLQIILIVLIFTLIVYILYFRDYIKNLFNHNENVENFQDTRRNVSAGVVDGGSTTTTTATENQQETTQATTECPSVEVLPDSSIISASDPTHGCLHVVLNTIQNEQNQTIEVVNVFVNSKHLPNQESSTDLQGFVTISSPRSMVNSRYTNRIVLDSLNQSNNNQKFIVDYIDNQRMWCILRLASNPEKLLSYTALNTTYQIGLSSKFPPHSEPCLSYHKSQIWLLKRNQLCETVPMDTTLNQEYMVNPDSNINVNNQTQTIINALTEVLERRQGTTLDPENENTRQCPEQNPQFSINLSSLENFQDYNGTTQNEQTIGEREEERDLNEMIENLTNVNNFTSTDSPTDGDIDCYNLQDFIDSRFTSRLASCNCK